MKKVILTLCVMATCCHIGHSQAATLKTTTATPVELNDEGGIAVTVDQSMPGMVKVICTSSQSGDGGVLDIVCLEDNSVLMPPQQIAMVNGRHEVNVPMAGKMIGRYCIHFHMSASMATATFTNVIDPNP